MYKKRIINIGEGENQISIELSAIQAIQSIEYDSEKNKYYSVVLIALWVDVYEKDMPRETLLSMWEDYLNQTHITLVKNV